MERILQVSHLSNQGYLAPLKYFDYKVVNPRLLKVNHTGMDFSDDSIKRYYAQIQFHERLSDIVLRLMKEGRKNILSTLSPGISSELGRISRKMNWQRLEKNIRSPYSERYRIMHCGSAF